MLLKLVENCESHCHMASLVTDTCLFRFFNFMNWLFSNYKERVIYNFLLKLMRMTLKKLLKTCKFWQLLMKSSRGFQSHELKFFWIQKGTSVSIKSFTFICHKPNLMNQRWRQNRMGFEIWMLDELWNFFIKVIVKVWPPSLPPFVCCLAVSIREYREDQ